jgi:hypothetical protein
VQQGQKKPLNHQEEGPLQRSNIRLTPQSAPVAQCGNRCLVHTLPHSHTTGVAGKHTAFTQFTQTHRITPGTVHHALISMGMIFIQEHRRNDILVFRCGGGIQWTAALELAAHGMLDDNTLLSFQRDVPARTRSFVPQSLVVPVPCKGTGFPAQTRCFRALFAPSFLTIVARVRQSSAKEARD